MTKTVLLGHFYNVSVKEGQTLKQGDRIGLMGNTGKSNGEHVHVAVAESAQTNRWYLFQSPEMKVSKKATEEFLAGGTLFTVKGKPHKNLITGGWLSYHNHYAIDLIADKAMELPDVIWPLKQPGTVVQVKDDGATRYGKVVLVQYDFEGKPTPGQRITYKVKAGDTLTSIAKEFGTTVEDIARDNAIQNPNLIFVDQVLVLYENQNQATIKVGDSVRITGTHYATGQAIPDWVKKKTHKVSEIAGKEALLGHPNGINSWLYLKDLKR
jgi:murein DD-endopeptidase MepM/ murein hydrolase activator NlpD